MTAIVTSSLWYLTYIGAHCRTLLNTEITINTSCDALSAWWKSDYGFGEVSKSYTPCPEMVVSLVSLIKTLIRPKPAAFCGID